MATTSTTDDAFHEIQLNGKQLVFLFMAVVVVSVVIFLCGVLVGRGVRSESGPVDALVAPASTGPVADAVPPTPPPGATSGPPTAAKEELSYPNRLASNEPTPERLRPVDAPPVAAPKQPAKPEPRSDTAAAVAIAPASGSSPPAPVSSATAEPGGAGFAIQVAALSKRSEAETVAHGLSTKGYTAYVMNPDAGAPQVFRVRVGKFKDRREAESIATRLQKEEQLKPWIVR
jgi:cell division septation protein DedD